jgi:transcriptional regulator with XRE-family HTH domain
MAVMPPRKHIPSVRSRRLRSELVRLREEKGISTEQVAEEMEWSRARVSRIETGKVLPRSYDVRALLDLYDVHGEEREQLLQLARDARRQTGWWYSYLDVMPEGFDMFVVLESEASSIRSYEPQVIPGLLQTEAYARAVFDAREAETSEEIDRLVSARMERQSVLAGDDRPEYWVILSEGAIRRQVGTSEIMRDQLRHLVRVSREPRITLQVIPFSRGTHPAMAAGPFVILGFPGQQDPDVVRLETVTGGAYVEGDAAIERYTLTYNHLRAAALPPDESRALIRAMANETKQNREST